MEAVESGACFQIKGKSDCMQSGHISQCLSGEERISQLKVASTEASLAALKGDFETRMCVRWSPRSDLSNFLVCNPA
jgi:hypothetical protein